MAAVRASMTPSAKALRMPASSHSPPRRSPTSVSYSSSVVAQSLERPTRLHRQRETGPHRQGAFVEEGSPERDPLRFDPGLLDRGDPGACRSAIVRRIASRVAAVVGGGMCRVTSSWAPSLSTPVASPVAGSRTITPSAGSGVSRSMPASAESRRVRPAGMAVEAAHERRAVGDDRVEQGAVGEPAGKRDVEPALAEDPGRVRSAPPRAGRSRPGPSRATPAGTGRPDRARRRPRGRGCVRRRSRR